MTALSPACPADCRWPDSRIAALIPAYRPPEALRDVVAGLRDAGCSRIVVVDDGSGPAYASLFAALAGRPGVALVAHRENRGKGAALRTGIAALLAADAGLAGIVTLDADGQHRPADAARLAAELHRSPESLILGARSFDDPAAVPWRSRIGNGLTRVLFRLFHGGGIRDTQTGLRGLPRSFVDTALDVPADRYEYELEILIRAVEQGRPIRNLPIETVYVDGNRASHFNPIVDSARIYASLLRFSLSSLLAVVFDFLAFCAALALSGNIAASLAAGRVVAVAINFTVNRNFVFRYRRKLGVTLAKYLSLVVALAALSYAAILFLTGHFGLGPVTAKIIAETALFGLSFLTQRHVVFAGGAFIPPEPDR